MIRQRRLFLISAWILVLVTSFGLRLINLTRLPVFADEAIYIRWAQVMRAEPTLRFLPLSDGKQPLFMWLLMPLFQFFADPLWTGRFLSVVAGLGSLTGLMILTYWLFRSRLVSVLAGLTYALTPYFFFFERLALVDALLNCFFIWSVLGLVVLVRYQRLDAAIITGWIIGLAWLTKSPATFIFALIPVSYLFLREERTKVLRLVGCWLVVLVVASGMYNLLRLGPGFEMLAKRNSDYVFSVKEVLGHLDDPFLPHLRQSGVWLERYFGLAFWLLVLLGLVWGLRKQRRKMLFLATWFGLPYLVQLMIARVFTARYLFFCLSPLVIVSAVGLLLNRKIYSLIFVGFVFSVIGFNYWLVGLPEKAALPADERRGYLEDWTAGYGISEVRDYLRCLNKPAVIGTEGSFGTLPDGLQMYFDRDRHFTIIGVGLGLNKIPEQLLDSAAAGTPTFLVANESRLGIKNDPRMELVLRVAKPQGEKNKDALLFYRIR